jgi:hypothetical protein
MQSKEIHKSKLSFVDAKTFGLSSKTKIGKHSDKDWFVVIDRKSRIIMKDGVRILDIVAAVRKSRPEINLGLAAFPAVCSKTTTYLSARGISVVKLIID